MVLGEESSIVGPSDQIDYLAIDEITDDLILCITGDGPCGLTATWGICRPSPPLGSDHLAEARQRGQDRRSRPDDSS